mmetsp:Transcript_10858/g.50068  ORF Transcript_10858/g.50068 Transcript_10858/m.50068 type:complete len:656 (-) Transcript_10858:849-2816(-)
MPKQKFNSHDIAAECATLRAKVRGAWLANIFDLDDKRTLLLKFTRSGGATESGEGEKTTVLMESGARFHTTSYARERKADQPSKFNAKLRMHLRGKRLNGVAQMGADRAVAFTFGAGETEHHLVLELYAQGNIILCDKDWRILTLLRPHRDDARGLVLLGNHPYPKDRFRQHTRVDGPALINALEGRDDREVSEGTDAKAAARAPGTVREALCKAFGYGPPVVDRAARLAGLDHGGAEKLPLTQPQIDALLRSLGAIDTWFEGVSGGDVVPCGVVTWRRKESDEGGDDESPSLEADFEDFSPFPFDDFPEGGSLSQFDQKVYATASVDGGFDGALDLFFASFEARRDRSQREKSANAAAKKLEKVKRDQEARVRALEKERQTQELAATLIEYNLTQVDAVLAAVNGALGGGMAWEDLTLMIKEEARAGNPVAGLVKTLDLPNNKVTVTLKNHLDVDTHDDDGDDDATVEGAGDEAVAALAASLESGVARVVLGDARASATTAAIADAIQSRPGPFPGARLAASTVAAAARMIAFVSPEDLREEIACAAVGERGTLADVAVADWLRDAVVDARDDRMFDAIREAAGYEKVDSGKQTGPPAAAFTLATETPRGLGEGCACYVYEAECTPWVGGPIVVAVVGAAHVDGIVRRWDASLG